MLFLLFGFWVLLNGQWTGEIAVVGAVLSVLIYLFIWKFMDYSPRKEWALVKRLPGALAYLGCLIVEIVRSCLATIRLIWSPKWEVQPRLVSFRTRLRGNYARVILANSITITPGTITVTMQGDKLLVHCLDEDFAEGLAGSALETRLMKLEGGPKAQGTDKRGGRKHG